MIAQSYNENTYDESGDMANWLKGASRNLFKATSKKEIYELVINSGPFKYNVYSATIGSLLTGWM